MCVHSGSLCSIAHLVCHVQGNVLFHVSQLFQDMPSLPSPLPLGWREENTDGEVFLVNDVTEEKVSIYQTLFL